MSDLKIPPHQLAWLRTMADQHGLPDEHKALRVLLEFAIRDGDQQTIFGEIRCANC